jgi:hypothetical protein
MVIIAKLRGLQTENLRLHGGAGREKGYGLKNMAWTPIGIFHHRLISATHFSRNNSYFS